MQDGTGGPEGRLWGQYALRGPPRRGILGADSHRQGGWALDGRQRRELRIFLCTAFLLPLAAACLRSRAEGTAVWWLLFGAEAAAPSLAAVAATAGGGRLRSFLRENFRAGSPLEVLALPVLIALVPMLLAKTGAWLLGFPFTTGRMTAAKAVTVLWALLAEELGWRGYLQPLFRRHMRRPCLAPCAVGLLWGLWHYHYFLFGDMRAPAGWFLLGCVAESYLHSCLLSWSKHNLLSSMVYHAAWNLFIHLLALQPAGPADSALPYGMAVVWEMLLWACCQKRQKRRTSL